MARVFEEQAALDFLKLEWAALSRRKARLWASLRQRDKVPCSTHHTDKKKRQKSFPKAYVFALGALVLIVLKTLDNVIPFFCNYILFIKLPWLGDSESAFGSSSQAATCPSVYHTW